MRFALLSALAILLVMIQIPAFADSALSGSGFGIISNTIQSISIQALVQDHEQSKIQNGTITMGGDSFQISTANLSLSNNKKTIQFNANTSDFTLDASGKLVLSAGSDSIYYVTGKTSDGDSFSTFVKLQQIQSISPEESTSAKDLLLLAKQNNRVQWKDLYKFTIRAFDKQSNPQSDFNTNTGYVNGVQISVTVKDTVGNVVKTTTGTTQKFGYYEDSILIPDNARTGVYTVTVTASAKNYHTITKSLSFTVIPLR
ncbi:MAG: hypothetical protein EB166_01635 [Thaumarchaeota archaeon]|nr:hypothetical protein [Nitrososphaeria archaeon]NDB89526.1 hypothetical protein [Nitrososphaerota archaeon]